MILIDDYNLVPSSNEFEIVNRIGQRQITHAIHDIDGTHSLIRNWPPVMSICLYNVIQNGLPEDFDSKEKIDSLVARTGSQTLPETDSFCIESAGLSALTQMEWAIRCGIQAGTVRIPDYHLTDEDLTKNAEIIEEIWQGKEVFEHYNESPIIKKFLSQYTPRLFRLYEIVLRYACRDANLKSALANPAKWQVPGSVEFLEMLYRGGIKNYFVTGAVVSLNEKKQPEGMLEEVLALGYSIGKGNLIEEIYGSSWNKKITKYEAITQLIGELDLKGDNILIVGDGRTEIQIAKIIGAVAISRLPLAANRQRQIHRNLDTNYIVADYANADFSKFFTKHAKKA
jgi:phosphoglycolate phosphatase-like HAD superfamily hydrolase